MKYLILFSLLTACSPTPTPKVEVGECILGQEMAVWKLLRKDEGKYLFVQYPEIEGSPVHAVTDLSTYKKVDCPIQAFGVKVR